MIKIIYAKTAEEASQNGADVITALLLTKKNAVLGLATGSSPVGMYTELIERCREGLISFKKVKTVNLDEYVGLSADHDQSYSYFMHRNLFDHIDIKEENTHLPNGLAEDPVAERARYDEVIASMGGVDIQVLGIGRNGHVGFNEPDDALIPATHLTDLTAGTIEANSRFFASEADVPKQALTMGIQSIFKARKIVLMASGKGKAEAVRAMLCGNITTRCPASLLCLHPDVTLVCDKDAYSLMA